MAVLTLGEYKKKKKQEEEQQQKVSNKKSSVMTLDEYKKQPGARLGRTDGSDIQYLPEESQKVIRLTEAKKKFDEKTNELDIATKRLDDIRTQNLKRAGVKTVQELLEEEKSERLPSYSFVKQGGSLSPYNSLNKKISENNAKYGQVNNNPEVLKEREKVNKIANDLIYSKYKYNVADVDNHKMSTMEKIFGTIPRAISDLGSAFSTDNIYIDENGKKIHLPTRDALLQQKASEDSSLPIKMLTDTIYNGTKILATEGLNLVSGGMGGTALYFNDMFNDSYKNAYNKTGDTGKAFANGLAQTGLEFITEKLLGGVSKQLTGGKASALENAISDKLYTKLGSKNLAKIAGSMGSEATEEFVQEFAGNAIDLLTLGSESGYKDIKDAVLNEEVLKAALYSGLVGGLSGGMITGMNIGTGLDKSAQKIQLVEDFKTQLEESKKNTTNEATIKALDTAIDNANKYLARPFTNLDNEEANLVLNRNIDNYTNNILPTQQNANVNTLENLQQFNQKQQSINDQQVQEEANKRIANIENEMNNLLPTASTEGMNLRQSAELNGLNPNSEVWSMVENYANKMSAKAIVDGSYFQDNSEGSLHIVDDKGNRTIVFNPSITEEEIIRSNAFHEILHDLLYLDRNSETILPVDKNVKRFNNEQVDKIVNYLESFDDYQTARADLEKTYSTITDKTGNLVYDPNSETFKKLINEEAAVHVLTSKFGNQESINQMVKQNRNFVQKVYDWVVEKLNSLINSGDKVRNERLFFEDLKKRIANSLNMKYNNVNTEAGTRLSKTKVDTYDKITYDSLTEDSNLTNKDYEVVRKEVFKNKARGIFDYNLSIDGRFLVYQQSNINFKIIKKLEEGKRLYDIDRYTNNSSERTGLPINKENNNSIYSTDVEYSRKSGTNEKILTRESQQKLNAKSNNIKSKPTSTQELDSSFSNETKYAKESNEWDNFLNKNISSTDNKGKELSDIDNYVNNNNFSFKKNGSLEINNLSNKQIKTLLNLYKTTGYEDVSTDYLSERLKQGNMVIPREVADRFIEKELGYKPQIDKTKVFEDSEGRKLTKEQVEFYKDSDVRDIRGRLIPVFHRTNAEFTVFDKKAGKQHGAKYGSGIYFSITPENYGNNTMEVYLNAKDGEYKYVPKMGYYIVQNSNQIKNVDNTNPTSNEDIRYSKEAKKWDEFLDKNVKPTGTTGTLMAIHNLNEDKLKGILELGGFPVPSIAITDPNKVNHSQFGNISVLFDKSTIDPAIKSNEVYDRDVWSPTFPTVDSEIIKDNLEKVADEIGIRDYYLEDYAERNSNVEDLIYTVLREDDVVNKYLDKNNINYDKDLSRKEIRQIAIDNGINEYLKDKLKDIFGEKGIYNGKEYITSSGKRRTFWQTHDKYNLANIVKILTRKSTINGQDTSVFSGGFGNIQANMSQRFNSIQEIKNAETRLKSTADNDIKPLQDNLSDSISKLTEYYGGYTSSNPFTTFSKVSEDIVDFASKKEQNISTLKEMLDEYGYKKVPDSILNDIVKSINDLKNIPTDYFEAKPQRAVGLDEVEAVVIPNTVSQEFRDALNDAGLDFVEYDPKVEGDRNRVINKFDNLKFSKNSNGKWQDFVNRHFKPSGTNTNIGSIKLPTKKQPTIPTKQTPKETTKQNILPINKELANKKVEQKVNKQGLEAIRKATNAGKSYLQLKRSEVRELRNELKEYLGLSKEQLTNAKTYNGIKNKVEQFMNKQVEYLDEDLKRVKKEVRNIKIKVDPSVREQITDYGEFRKQNFGKLRLTSDGINVDSVYSELSELYPYYFDSSITSEADMLYELSDFMDKPNTIIEEYKLSDSDMQKATDKIFNSLINNSLSNEDIESMQNDILEKYSRRTRKVVQEEVLNDMGVTVDDISKGKDISAAEFQRTDPVRVNEKVFGAEVGQKMNDATVNRTKHNEAEGIRFLNKEREDIRELGIKPRSKESAAVQKYGEKQYLNKENELVKYGDIELANEFPNVKIQEKIKHAAEVIRNKYDKYIEQINNVITRLGYDPIPKRPDYMRHFQEINDKLSQWGIPLNPTDLNKENIPTDINGLTDQFRPGKNWFASALQRKGFKTTYDAITGIDGYLESAKNLIYHTEDIQRYRALSKFIRDTYGQTHGMDNVDIDTEEGQQRLNDIFDNKLSKYVAWLDEQANSLAGKKGGIDRAAERILGRKVYTIMDAAKKQVGSNMTGFNVRSALTNFASAVQGASKTNKLAFIKGTLSTLGNIVHNDGLINKSDFLTSRFGSDQLSKKLWQKASNAGQIFMTGSDYFTSNQIWRSKYYENLSKGMTESQAIKKADDFAARIMGDRSKGATAEIFNSKTLGLLTQFQLEVNNQWSSIIHDNKMDLKTGNKSGATVVFQLGQLAAMSYFFNNFMKSLTGSDVMIDPIDMFKKLLGSDDDDDDKEKTLEQRATEVFGDLINDLPFASFLTGGRIPMAEAFTGVETAFKKLTNQKDKFGNDIKWDDVKKDAISSGFYWLLPTGYGQVRKTSKGLSMYDKKLPVPGSYTESGNLRFDADTSTGGKVKAALFGQYSSKQAQDYIDSGYKTIRKQNLPEMKDLGMNASEYRKYREQLSSAGKKSIQKINYVDDSDYAEKQKNIMYKNILKLKDKELSVVNNMSIKDQNKYLTTRTQANSINSDKDIESSEKKQRISNLIIDTNLSDKDMAYLYSKYCSSEDKINMILDMNIPIKEYIKADTKEVNGSYYAKTGKTVKNSKMKEYAKYVNTLNLSAAQKAIIIKMKYNSFKTYDNKIVNYVNNINTSANEKKVMLKSIGFKNFDKDVINYINSQHISREEKEKKLKGLGFTIRDGRVYYK